MKLYEADIIESDLGFFYADIPSIKDTSELHDHDFYEIFATYGGSVYHWVNGEKKLLPESSLVFIRPGDRHSYEKLPQNDCRIMNIAFPAATVKNMLDFLGPSRLLRQLLDSPLPPAVVLPAGEARLLKDRFHRLAWTADTDPGNAEISALFKVLLTEILFRHFKEQPPEASVPAVPAWFGELQTRMMEKEHFIEGLPALYRMSPKSPEHVSRCIKRYLGLTPTQWINGLRLQYAANLLSATDAEIIAAAMEAGFDNLSHFYHIFKRKFGLTPVQYRQTHRKIVIPD